MIFHKTTMIAAASAIALMAAETGVQAANDKHKSPAAEKRMGQPAPVKAQTQVQADTLVGKNVENTNGDDIGEIDSVIIDKDGQVAAVIVAVGGFLGMGEHEVALNWNELNIQGDGEAITTAMTKDQLKALPQYKYENPERRRSAFIDNGYLEQQRAVGSSRVAAAERGADAVLVPAKGLRLSKLIGAEVINSDRDDIGEVDDIVVADGKALLILSVGEFLGMGGHHVAVELNEAKIFHPNNDPDDLEVSVQMTKDQLKALPKYDVDNWDMKKKM